MKNLRRVFRAGLVSLILTFSSVLAVTDFGHYQIILDKNPFGSLGPAAPIVIPEYAKNLRLCGTARINNNFYAGFYESVSKTDFLLKKGETSENGITLEDIDITNESAKISSAGLSTTLYVQALPIPTNAPPGTVMGNSSSMPVSSSSGQNPWAQFYQRYQQRHANDGAVPISPILDVRNADGSPRILSDTERQAVMARVRDYQLSQQGDLQQSSQQTKRSYGINPNAQQYSTQQPGVQVEQFLVQQPVDQQSSSSQKQPSHSKKRAQ